jgi:hypothetical protein
MILVDDANRDETVAIAKAMSQVKVQICERKSERLTYLRL